MDEVRQRLAFLTDWLPDDIRSWLPIEAWWLVALVVVLAALLLVGLFLKAFFKAAFRRRRKSADWEPELREDLSKCPLANSAPSAIVFHLPARLRLVILAPTGKGTILDPDEVIALLDRVIPGLGALVKHDRPRVVLWPPPVSAMGFAGSFHRATPTHEAPEDLSRWVILAGRANGAGRSMFVGLALWTDEPSSLGRKNLEPGQWLEVLRPGSGSRA